MQSIENILELISEYLKTLMEPMSFFDFFVTYISPILQLIVIVGGAIAGLYKYFKTKNQEIYQKLLSEVYAPLYQYFVKQELLRQTTNMVGNYKDTPILEYSKTETITDCITNISTTQKEYFLELNRQELIKVLDSINIGLASKELYTLLSMYKVLVHLEEKYDDDTEDFNLVKTKKIKIENKLRQEIVLGYTKYHNKLGIKSGIANDFLELKGDEFIFKI